VGAPISRPHFANYAIFPGCYCQFRIPVGIKSRGDGDDFADFFGVSASFEPHWDTDFDTRFGKIVNFPGRFCAFRIPVSIKSNCNCPRSEISTGFTVHFASRVHQFGATVGGHRKFPPVVSVHFGFRSRPRLANYAMAPGNRLFFPGVSVHFGSPLASNSGRDGGNRLFFPGVYVHFGSPLASNPVPTVTRSSISRGLTVQKWGTQTAAICRTNQFGRFVSKTKHSAADLASSGPPCGCDDFAFCPPFPNTLFAATLQLHFAPGRDEVFCQIRFDKNLCHFV
jgi:hypothetical protein